MRVSRVSRAFILLYSGYCISCVVSTSCHQTIYIDMQGDRLWTFAIVFILERLGGMRLVCINQLIEGVSAMLLSTYVGNWLDRHDRRYGLFHSPKKEVNQTGLQELSQCWR